MDKEPVTGEAPASLRVRVGAGFYLQDVPLSASWPLVVATIDSVGIDLTLSPRFVVALARGVTAVYSHENSKNDVRKNGLFLPWEVVNFAQVSQRRIVFQVKEGHGARLFFKRPYARQAAQAITECKGIHTERIRFTAFRQF